MPSSFLTKISTDGLSGLMGLLRFNEVVGLRKFGAIWFATFVVGAIGLFFRNLGVVRLY